MKLLFDHNLPPLLVSRLANLFPQSQHVFALGLDRASDWEIRDYARQNGFHRYKGRRFQRAVCAQRLSTQDNLDSAGKLLGDGA